MKKYMILMLFVLMAGASRAQLTAIDRAADSTCKCLTAVNDQIKSAADFDSLGLACILKAAFPFLSEISKEEGLEPGNLGPDGGKKFGEKIGVRLGLTCPVFLDLLSKYNTDAPPSTIKGTVEGTIANVELKEHVYLTIKTANGKTDKLVWVDYFEGANDYKANPLLLKGKRVSCNWKQAKVYIINDRDFVAVKSITALQIK